MELVRSICHTEIPALQQKIDAFSASFRESLESLRIRSQETAQYQVKLEEVKVKLREAEDDLVKALGVKTRKEAKRMELMDAIASAKARTEDLKSSVQEHRTKNSEYDSILSQYSLASEGPCHGTEQKEETQEAISWYNRVLGFHVEGGNGVKFTFKNINVENPNEECFFTIRYENYTYTMLNCEPSLKDTEDLIHELNKTNGLFKFVKVMRRKFQEAVGQGTVALDNEHQESSFISASAPELSLTSCRSDSPTKKNEDLVQPPENNRHFKKQNLGRRVDSSAISVRQSPRLKARKSR